MAALPEKETGLGGRRGWFWRLGSGGVLGLVGGRGWWQSGAGAGRGWSGLVGAHKETAPLATRGRVGGGAVGLWGYASSMAPRETANTFWRNA